MRLAIAIPEEHVTPAVLDSGLEATTRLDEQLIASGVPTFRKAVQGGRIKWAPEPPGEERFDHATTVIQRGWGDCDDLAPWHAAGLRATGEDPDAFARVVKSGPRTWHAVVQRSDGSLDDPSREAGMGHALGVVGAVKRALARGARPSIAVRPIGGHFVARADLPWVGRPLGTSIVGYAHAYDPEDAIEDVIDGTCSVGRCAGIVAASHALQLEEALQHRDLVGVLCNGKAGWVTL